MLKLIVPILGFCLILIFGVQQYVEYSENKPDKVSQKVTQQTQNQVAAINVREQKPEPIYGRKARIKMDNRGHFVVTARMNNRNVEVLVDTGATSVAINKKTASRLGINLSANDFKYTVNTANGTTKAATAMINKIQIGKVTVKNVRAMVLDDKALSSTLLGMSFLGQLNGFEVKNRELLLVQ